MGATTEPCGGCGEADPKKACIGCLHFHSPTPRETADRETLVMQSIIDAHGQWEIENRNRKQGDGQLWQDGHVRLLAQAAIIAADHIGEANEKVTADHAELARLAEAATQGPWTNIDALRGEKKSVWVADTAREETERDGVTPSRYGPSRTTICNALASNYSLPDGGYKTLDPYPNAAFIAAANPATVKNLLSEIAALRGDLTETRVAADLLVSSVRADLRQAERQRDEAVGLLRLFDGHLGEDEPMWTDDSTVTGEWIGSDGIRHSLTFGMFRRIRAFLANQGADQ